MVSQHLKANYAIAVALLAALAVSSIWYSPWLFGRQWMELRGMNTAGRVNTGIRTWKMFVGLIPEFIVVYVLAHLISGLGNRQCALQVGFWVWLGCPLQMLVEREIVGQQAMDA